MSVNDYEHELYEFIRELRDGGQLEKGTRDYNIAIFTVYHGYNALSRKQRRIYDQKIAPLIGRLAEKQEIAARIYSADD